VLFGDYQFDLYSLLSVIVMAVCAISAALIWQRRRAPGARYLFLLNLAQVLWTGASLFEVASIHISHKIFWSQVGYAGITSSPLLFLLFTLAYAERSWQIKARTVALLVVAPVLTFLLAATNGAHHLIWSDVTMSPGAYVAVFHHGPLFWFFVGFVYLLYAAGAVILMRALFHVSKSHRRQIAALLIASVPPLLVNVLYVYDLAPWGRLDITPLSFAFTGIVLSIAIYQEGFLDLVPAARDMVIEGLSQGVIVLDGVGRIMDINSAAQRMLASVETKVIGCIASKAIPDWSSLGVLPERGTREVTVNEGKRHLELHVSGLDDSRQGRIIMIRDVTERYIARQERERLLAELQARTEELGTLSGMLPICPLCKNIRDDAGFWHRVEDYVSGHADVTFTHGICPDCITKLYPDIAEEINREAMNGQSAATGDADHTIEGGEH